MASDRNDIRAAILGAISESKQLRALLEGVPANVADTVQRFVPVDTGTAKASIEAKSRKTPYRRIGTRRIKIGQVYSDDDFGKIGSIEYGRSESDDSGATPEFAPFRKAAAVWDDLDL